MRTISTTIFTSVALLAGATAAIAGDATTTTATTATTAAPVPASDVDEGRLPAALTET